MTNGAGPQLAQLLDAREPAPACLIDLNFDFVSRNRPFTYPCDRERSPPVGAT